MASELLIAYHDGSGDNARKRSWQDRLVPYLSPHFSTITLVDLNSDDAMKADAALVWAPPHGRLAQLRQNKIILSLGQGVDHLLRDPELPVSIPIVRLVDPNMSHALSQWVILNILDHYRDGPFYRAARLSRQFIQKDQRETDNLKVAVYGMGAIGQVIATRLHALGFDVSGWARTPKQDTEIPILTGRSGFAHLLSHCMCHVCILPLTPETENLFNARAFAAMPAGAFFVNGGRGGHVAEQDLLAAITSGHLAGAALDVFATEPLPDDHPFWDEPRIAIWPHIAAQTNPDTAARQVADAIIKSYHGQMPDNQIDRLFGY